MMNYPLVLDDLSLLAAGGALVLGTFVVARLFQRPRPFDDSTRLLALLIGVCALNAAHPALIRGSGFFEPLQFALPPLLAAYARAAVGRFRFRWTQVVHFLPLVAAVAVAAWFTIRGVAPLTVSVAFWSCLSAQMVGYLGSALRLFHRYQRGLVDTVSNLAPVDLGWLRRFFWVAAGLCLAAVAVLVLLLHDLNGQVLAPGVAVALAAAVWVLALRGLDQRVAPSLDPEPVSSGGERPTLGSAEAAKLGRSLEALFATEKPYLDPDLDLATLAGRLGVPRNHLSFVINSELGMNFYELVNRWRVDEFRKLAGDPVRDGDKILTLAFDSGFNAKPTFNKVVLKMTGMTPSQVRAVEIESRSSR